MADDAADGGSRINVTNPDSVPQNSNIKPALDSIFAEIEKSLPTIDFEISDVSSEEDIPIFHRALQAPTEDSDDDDDDDDGVSSSFSDDNIPPNLDQLKFAEPSMTTLGMKLSGEDCATRTASTRHESTEQSKYRPVGVSTSTDVPVHSDLQQSLLPPLHPLRDNWMLCDESGQTSSKLPVSSPQSVGENPEKGPRITESSGSDVNSRAYNKVSKKEGSSAEVVSRYMPRTPPKLILDNIDIDEILSSTVGISSQGARMSSPSTKTTTQREKEGPSLIQKLAQLSVEQSGTSLTDIDPSTGALKKRSTGLKDIKTARNLSVSSEGKSIESHSRLPVSDLVNLPTNKLTHSSPSLKKDEPETVYLDLRRFDEKIKQQKQSIERVRRVLGLNRPQQDSSDDDDDDPQKWVEQRRKIKQSLEQTGTLPEELIAKPKATSSRDNQFTNKPRTQAQKLAPCFRVPPVAAKSTTEAETSRPQQAISDEEKEKAEKLAAARKLQEQRQNERQSRIRLGQYLEAVRPTLSDKGHFKCAEATPTLFDIDASYEPAPRAIPLDLMSDVELVLLSVRLSSNGEMVVHRGATHKSVDKGSVLSASYTTLITWLLSLVPDNFDFLKMPPSEPITSCAPFRVIGLQQMVLDGEFRLFVAVTPVEKFTPRDAPVRMRSKMQKRDEIKDSSPFQQILTKYFSRNTLHDVCPWLENFDSVEITKGNQGHKEGLVAYRPSFPSITKKPLSTFIQVNPDSLAAAKVFETSIGFFWQTRENDESHLELNLNEDGLEFDTQNTMSLIYKKVYRNSIAMMGILNRILQDGLDLAGLRLLYPTPELLSVAARHPGLPAVGGIDQENSASALDVLNHIGPIVALAIRGAHARTVWLRAVGPSDPVLARRTDPASLSAAYGGQSRDECPLFCPRSPDRVHSELCRWFGGRVPPSGVINIGPTSNELLASGRKVGKKAGVAAQTRKDIVSKQPAATLTAVTRADIIVFVSPVLPTKCLGLILTICQQRGYHLRGVKRCRLSAKRAVNVGLSGLSASVFANQPITRNNDKPHDKMVLAHGPATFLLLNKENAFHGAGSLIEAFMVELSILGIYADLAGSLMAIGSDIEMSSSLLFHVVPYSESILSTIGDISKTPHSDLNSVPGYITPRLHTNPELEQFVVLTLTGHHLLKTSGVFLGQVLGVLPYCKSTPTLEQGLELLGIKWLPSLSLQHAKEITPYEVGEPAWKPSLQKLTSEPAMIFAVRGVSAFKRLEQFLASHIRCSSSHNHLKPTPHTLELIMSLTPETAYRQATLFFHKSELHPDPSVRVMLKYLPPTTPQQPAQVDYSSQNEEAELYNESLFETMLSGPRPIPTLLLCKPNVVQHHLAKLMRRLAQEGFAIVGMRLVILQRDQALIAIPTEDKDDEVLRDMHIDYLTSAPSLILALLRENAVKKLIDLIGPSDPKKARTEGSGLWRGVFGIDPVVNGLHSSASYVNAIRELKLFFPEGLCCKQTNDLEVEQISCPCHDTVANLADYRRRDVVVNVVKPAESGQEPTTKCSGNTSRAYLPPVTALTQTNCVVLTPALFVQQTRNKKLGFVDVLEHLLSKGFHIVGARMLWLTEEQAQNLLHINGAGSFTLVPLLTSGQSVALALQRDNAVMAFESLLGSVYEKDSVLARYGKDIILPKDCTHANRFLCYFFNELIPAAHMKIIIKSEENE